VLEVREMFKKLLPFVLVAIALSVAFSVLFATHRMGHNHPVIARFMKRSADLPIEPVEPEPEV
jgi:hypothetical protein